MGEAPPADAEPVVLVIDDEDVVREVASLLLESAGFRVVAAASGDEAVAAVAAEGEALDVVLLDVMLPDRDGPSIAAALRELRPGLPIVVSSGYDEQTVADRIGTIEDAGFIRKPYGASELVDAVSHAIARR
jgi:two-component system cell cycle sensor histidine kinase/response regulator CckA